MTAARAVANTGRVVGVAAAGFTFGAAVTVAGFLLAEAVVRVARRVLGETQR